MLKKESKEPVQVPILPSHPSRIASKESNDFETQTCPSFYGSLIPTAKNDLVR